MNAVNTNANTNTKLDANQIRTLFVEYFESKDHKYLPSSSLIPTDDPTLLFTNAGMVQFKDYFLGIEKPPHQAVVTSQKCVRAGGKHNDLHNVGYTARHHTFFEMLGNFSFGKYFKHEAIQFAWDFLTKILHIPAEKLWVTVYHKDMETEEIWINDIGIDPNCISRCGKKDNFWSMGDTGPCGPCTEIFYDHGPDIPGGPPGSPNEDEGRYIEIWNLVFMQYERNSAGEMNPLPSPCVDTGMGLERIAAVMQNVHDNYDIYYFRALLRSLQDISNTTEINIPMRVIVDHIRSASFLVADGVVPSNEGRGYVLRRIIRRAIRYGYKLGLRNIFFYKLVAPLSDIMGHAYPELSEKRSLIEQVLQNEEKLFATTLINGLKIMDQHLEQLTGSIMPGDLIFQLYDTYGFPPDLSRDIALERGLNFDEQGFENAMKRQRKLSSSTNKFNFDYTEKIHIKGESQFIGYDILETEAKIIAMLYENKPVSKLSKGDHGVLVLDVTPFYAESGGQVGDNGDILFKGGCFQVENTIKYGQAIFHKGKVVEGELTMARDVVARVSRDRQSIMLNHSATHILHQVLQNTLGESVVQKGSLVCAEYLRFDFSCNEALSKKILVDIETQVNAVIRQNLLAKCEIMPLERAKQAGAMALFNEKYGEEVRVISFGNFSIELCGGTHVTRTGDIGLFKIRNESAVAAGIRRIEACTGQFALDYIDKKEHTLSKLAKLLKTDTSQIENKLVQFTKETKELEKKLTEYKQRLASSRVSDLKRDFVQVADISVLAVEVKDVDRTTLRHMMDSLKVYHNNYAIVLTSVIDEEVALVVGVSKTTHEFFTAVDLLKFLTKQIDGKGGGRPDLAQGGGHDIAKLSKTLSSVVKWIDHALLNHIKK